MAERLLDVSELEPCEPLEQTLAALPTLAPGDYLRVLHRREPYPLFPMLEQQGFGWFMRPGAATAVEVIIWRETDPQAATAALKLRPVD